jgi:GNAT superfamily N-acetyltransferase
MSVAELPPHAVEAVRELARRRVPMQKIAFMTKLSLQTVLEVITVSGTDQEFAVCESDFETVLPFWRDKLWPGRKTPINSVSSMAYLGGYNMDIYQYKPVFFVAQHCEKIVGVISGFETAPGWFRSRGVWVDPHVTGRGYGRALMQALEKAALDRRCTNLWTIPRQSAMPYYERMGFKRTSDWFDEGVEYGPNAYALKTLVFETE